MRIVFPLTAIAAVALSAALVFAFQRGHGAGGDGAASAQKPAAPAAAPLGVEVYAVRPEPLEVTLPATGRLLARESVELVSELSRRLAKVRAVEGAAVKKGDVLFELDTADLRAEAARLDVEINLAKALADRATRMLAEGVSTQQEAESAQAKQAELQARRRVLEVTLSKTTIRAPFSGTIGLRSVSEGAWVSPSTVLVSLHDTSQLKLDFTLPERYAGLIAPGGEFRFRVEGRPEAFTGKVVAFEPSVEQATRSLLVRGVVENTNQLVPGAFVTVDLPLRVDQALLVPNIAVIPGADGRRVFVDEAGVARSVKVELGARSVDRVQVLGGLEAGDRVIVSNLLRLRDGAKVTAKAAPGAAP